MVGRTSVAAALLTILLAGGCQPRPTRIMVRGGPSLNSLFAALGKAFEAQAPGLQVTGDFTCPPCILLQQGGARPRFDLFVALGEQELRQLQTAPARLSFDEQRTIGHTRLVLVTAANRPTAVRRLADLHRPGLRRVGIGDPQQTSVGHFAQAALKKSGLWEELRPHFVYARSGCELLKWLALGRDLDAAIVYGLCVEEIGGSVRPVAEFPPEVSPPVPVILAMVTGTRHPEAVRAFMDFCTSAAAAPLLAKHRVRPELQP